MMLPDVSTENHNNQVGGMLCLKTSAFDKHARKRSLPLDPRRCGVRGYKTDATVKSNIGSVSNEAENGTAEIVQYDLNQPSSPYAVKEAETVDISNCSYGRHLSLVKQRKEALGNIDPTSTVKAEPRCDDVGSLTKIATAHKPGNPSPNNLLSHRLSRPGARHSGKQKALRRRVHSPAQDPVHTTSQRIGYVGSLADEGMPHAKKRIISSEAPDSSLSHGNNAPSSRIHDTSLPTAGYNSPRPTRTSPHPEWARSYLQECKRNDILRYEALNRHLNPPPRISDMPAWHHDPTSLLHAASLGSGSSVNPFLGSIPAYMRNPFVVATLGQSQLMAAAAYRQAFAAQLWQSGINAMNPVYGMRFLDATSPLCPGWPNFMYGFPDPTHFTNPMKSMSNQQSPKFDHKRDYYGDSIHGGVREDAGSDSSKSMHSEFEDSPADAHVENNLPIGKNVCAIRDKRNCTETMSTHDTVMPSGSLPPREAAASVRQERRERQSFDTTNSSTRNLAASSEFRTSKTPENINEFENFRTKRRSEQSHLHVKKSVDTTPEDITSRKDDGADVPKTASYKNLTRERRLVANARERTRVHTISSAFEELRRQIPSYSCNQKLSKLAILRIACSYIQSLSVLAGRSREGTFKESVDQCTRVLQAESKARCRRKNTKAQVEREIASTEKPSTSTSNECEAPGWFGTTSSSPLPSEYWQESNHFLDQSERADNSSHDSSSHEDPAAVSLCDFNTSSCKQDDSPMPDAECYSPTGYHSPVNVDD